MSQAQIADWTFAKLLPQELQYLRAAIDVRKALRLSSTDERSHEALWGSKAHRLFPQHVVDKIKDFHFLKAYPGFRLAPVTLGTGIIREYEEAYWRLVRPNSSSDVGTLHADCWFHAKFSDEQGPLFAGDERTLKCWIAVECEGRNGLCVGEDAMALDTPPGIVVIFNDRLLHRGAVNRGKHDRISVELTLVLKR